ncbi:hypothetical protein HanRHA438_Chr17g0820181 [Helianthus annuus]|nr:hypothetical protein HanRHA438_Chr17g0820181 [Helianthus annuus]
MRGPLHDVTPTLLCVKIVVYLTYLYFVHIPRGTPQVTLTLLCSRSHIFHRDILCKVMIIGHITMICISSRNVT